MSASICAVIEPALSTASTADSSIPEASVAAGCGLEAAVGEELQRRRLTVGDARHRVVGDDRDDGPRRADEVGVGLGDLPVEEVDDDGAALEREVIADERRGRVRRQELRQPVVLGVAVGVAAHLGHTATLEDEAAAIDPVRPADRVAAGGRAEVIVPEGEPDARAGDERPRRPAVGDVHGQEGATGEGA
jgi:hypothetical protein